MIDRRTCQICGAEFIPTQGGRVQIYCGAACRRRAYDLTHGHRLPASSRSDITYRYAGYTLRYNTPVEDYQDFATADLSGTDVKYTLAQGYMPPGLLLRCGKKVFEVCGRYLHPQTLKEVER